MARQSPTLRHSGQAKRRSGTHAVDGCRPMLAQNGARLDCSGQAGWGWQFCNGQLAASAFGMGSGSAAPSGMTKCLGFLQISTENGAQA